LAARLAERQGRCILPPPLSSRGSEATEACPERSRRVTPAVPRSVGAAFLPRSIRGFPGRRPRCHAERNERIPPFAVPRRAGACSCPSHPLPPRSPPRTRPSAHPLTLLSSRTNVRDLVRLPRTVPSASSVALSEAERESVPTQMPSLTKAIRCCHSEGTEESRRPPPVIPSGAKRSRGTSTPFAPHPTLRPLPRPVPRPSVGAHSCAPGRASPAGPFPLLGGTGFQPVGRRRGEQLCARPLPFAGLPQCRRSW